MAKKKKGQRDDAENEDDKAAEDPAAEVAAKIREQMDQFGSAGVKAQIQRIKRGERDKYLDQVEASAIVDNPMGYIKDRWGGGTFKVGLRDAKGGWIKGSSYMVVEIEGEPIVETPVTEETRKLEELEKRVEEALDKNSRGDISTGELIKLQMELTREQMRELRNPPAAAASANIPEMIVSMMTAISQSQQPLLAALVERANEKPKERDAFKEMAGMVELIGAIQALNGDSNAKGWERVVDRLANPLGALIEQHAENQRMGTAPPSTMPAGPVSPNPPPNAGAPMSASDQFWAYVRRIGPELLQHAQAGRDPEIIADYHAELIPDEALGPVFEHLSDPGFLNQLQQVAPQTAPHMAWFKRFAARVCQHVEYQPSAEEVTEDDDAAPEVGTTAAPHSAEVAGGDEGE